MNSIRQLRVAAIMDEFTESCFLPECELLPLTPDGWKNQIALNPPHLLLVESAWWGFAKLWHRKISEAAPELRGLVAWCKVNNIPTVFWNKEDPVHFERFLITASLFDRVFTTDISCIPCYKKALGHDRVHLLPFACQPEVHNPVEIKERNTGACFAGSYYLRFPHRSIDLRNLLYAVSGLMTVDIFDRNFQSDDANYRFPTEYRHLIKGMLSVDEMHLAYKGYRFGLNINTVKHSQTMFARRVFELLGSGTMVLSNDSVGVRGFFGDVVLCSDDGADMKQLLAPLVNDDIQRARQALAGVRAVMLQHTYAHRLDAVAQRLWGHGLLAPLPIVLLMAFAETFVQIEALQECALQQRYTNWCFVLVVPATIFSQAAEHIKDQRLRIVPWIALEGLTLYNVAQNLAWPDQTEVHSYWTSGWLPQDYYGPNYLLDMILATRYTPAQVLGKGGYFVWTAQNTQLVDIDKAYRPGLALAARNALAKNEVIANELAQEWLQGLSDRLYENNNSVALDVFNYCRDGIGNPDAARIVNDRQIPLGLDLQLLMDEADALPPLHTKNSIVPFFNEQQLSKVFGVWLGQATFASLDDYGWHIVSELPDDQFEEVWSLGIIAPGQLRAFGIWRFHVVTSGGQQLQFLVQCLDFHDEILLNKAFDCNQNHQITLPFGTRNIRLGWKMISSGSVRVKKLSLGWK